MSTTERTRADVGPAASEHVGLLVGGMTCASCVARVEKKLNRLADVQATVDLATASTSVDYDPATTTPEADLHATVERTGYTAAVASPGGGEVGADDNNADEAATLVRRLLLAVPLSLAVVDLTMTPVGTSSGATPAGCPGWPWCSPHRSCCSAGGAATAPPSSTPDTVPRRWTRWSRSARRPASAGRWCRPGARAGTSTTRSPRV